MENALQLALAAFQQRQGAPFQLVPSVLQKNTPPVSVNKEKPESKKKPPEPKKPSRPHKVSQKPKVNGTLQFIGEYRAEPLVQAASRMFGLDLASTATNDLNTLSKLVEMSANKIGTTDTNKILKFLSKSIRESKSLERWSGLSLLRSLYAQWKLAK